MGIVNYNDICLHLEVENTRVRKLLALGISCELAVLLSLRYIFVQIYYVAMSFYFQGSVSFAEE